MNIMPYGLAVKFNRMVSDMDDRVRRCIDRGRTYGHVSSEERVRVVICHTNGMTHKEIADVLDIKIKRVEYILNKYRTAVGG